jgi:hypothetical protein
MFVGEAPARGHRQARPATPGWADAVLGPLLSRAGWVQGEGAILSDVSFVYAQLGQLDLQALDLARQTGSGPWLRSAMPNGDPAWPARLSCRGNEPSRCSSTSATLRVNRYGPCFGVTLTQPELLIAEQYRDAGRADSFQSLARKERSWAQRRDRR